MWLPNTPWPLRGTSVQTRDEHGSSIAVKPERVGILDMEKRFPSAIEAAMARWTRAPFRFRISVSQLHATLSSLLVRNPGIKSAKQATYP